MSEFHDQLRAEFADPDYRAAYADSFVDAWIGMQIKVLREQREMTQKEFAEALNTTQTAISRLESANYSGRTIGTLKAVARVLDCRLRVSFETYGSLIGEADQMSVDFLKRPSFNEEFSELATVSAENINGNLDSNGFAVSPGLAEMVRCAQSNPNHEERRSSVRGEQMRAQPLRKQAA